jgi:amino acid permease
VNNISGAGMLTLPKVFQDAGWVVPTLVFIVICVSSSLAATFLTDAMVRIPGNSQFDLRVEFACIFGEFFGPKMKHLAQAMLMICFYSQIIAGIVAAAQVVDALVVFFNPTSTTWALQMLPSIKIVSWTAPDYDPTDSTCSGSDGEVPFINDGSGVIITLGYVLLCLFLVPFSFGTLDDNISGQKLSFILLLCFSTVFVAQFVQEGLEFSRVPAFGESYRTMLGSIIFNYAFIVMVPSWLNEKRAEVSVNKTVWTATITSTILYLAGGNSQKSASLLHL